MRARAAAAAILTACYLAGGGCGKYGPPLREPPEPPEATEPAPTRADDERDDEEANP
ncbi:MAG: hypothetical protein JSU66_17135 [Deltaproteobacteria bacterium]|nr:MAG: hypothetical protein JSU66_17135 [Deltaproteobacteria bacterium]